MAGPATWGYQVLGFGAGIKPVSTTTKVQVTLAVFDSGDGCSCAATGSTQIWEDDMGGGGSALEPSVGDWILGQNGLCAQVTAINVDGSVDDYTYDVFANCAACNDYSYQCFGGGGPGGPGKFCLLPDMLVKLIDGSLAKVMDLNLGDLIESSCGFTEVNRLIKDHPRDGYYIIEDELYISNDHPILVDGKMVRAEDYAGDKRYVESSTNTIYIGTVAPTFNVYCKNNVYAVDGQY